MQQGCLDYERELFEHIERLDKLSSTREIIAMLAGLHLAVRLRDLAVHGRC